MTALNTYQLLLTKNDQQGWLQIIHFLFPLAEKVEFQPHTAYYSSGEQLQWTPTDELKVDLQEQVIVSSSYTNMRKIFFNFHPTPKVLDFIVAEVSPATTKECGHAPVPTFYRDTEVLMEWDHVCFWLKLTKSEAQTLRDMGTPVIGPYTQRRQYWVELRNPEQDWLRLLDFLLPKSDRVTFQASLVTVCAQDQYGNWREDFWQWSPPADLGSESMGQAFTDDRGTFTWSFPLSPTVEQFVRSNEILGYWHIANDLPEDPCLYIGEEKILTTISHEDAIRVRLFEVEVQALLALDFADIFP